jgi:hypothetical protein
VSILRLPRPEHWDSENRRLIWATIAFAVPIAPFAYWGVVAALRGHYLTAVVLLGLLVFPVLISLSLHLVAFGRTTLRASSDATGTTLRTARLLSGAFFIGLAAFVVSGVLFIIFLPAGALDIPVSRGWQIFSPILMAVAVVFAMIGLANGYRRGGLGYVELSPTGVAVANILTTDSVGWSDVVDVKDTSGATRTRKAVVLSSADGSEKVIDGADFYVPEGVPFYWMVRHYWLHSEDRAELTDGRALKRLGEQRFDVT